MYKIIFLLFSISLSQNNFDTNGQRHGLWRGYHENNNLKYEGQFFHGLEFGVFQYYDYNQNLVIKLNYVDTGITSYAQIYYPDLSLKGEGKYVNKEKTGFWISYDLNGRKISSEYYVNGVLDGECQYFFSSGELAEKYYYTDGLRKGQAEIFYNSGMINAVLEYKANKLHGLAFFYYDNTNHIESQGKYYMGKKDSTWLYYNTSGHLISTEYYDRGRQLSHKNNR